VGSPEKNLIPDIVLDEVTSIDREAKTVSTVGGDTLGYDCATAAEDALVAMRGDQH
jgi:NADH dehydrogenase FAD-containing subunit